MRIKKITFDVILDDASNEFNIVSDIESRLSKMYLAKILRKSVDDIENDVVITKIKEYMFNNCMDSSLLKDTIDLYYSDEQFKEAVEKDYEIMNYDDWKHLQKLFGTKISYKTAKSISHTLYELEDIDIADLPFKTPDSNKITLDTKGNTDISDDVAQLVKLLNLYPESVNSLLKLNKENYIKLKALIDRLGKSFEGL